MERRDFLNKSAVAAGALAVLPITAEVPTSISRGEAFALKPGKYLVVLKLQEQPDEKTGKTCASEIKARLKDIDVDATVLVMSTLVDEVEVFRLADV